MTPREQDQQAALRAALEDLARVKQERDELAEVLEGLENVNPAIVRAAIEWWGVNAAGPIAAGIMAAHDRQVAARVLESVALNVMFSMVQRRMLRDTAEAYRIGEREVPNG